VEYALNINNLSKRLGAKQVLNGISFDVRAGEVFGLIGPNGAGKTTTLRIISTLLRIDSGSVSVLNLDLPGKASEIRKIISYLPEDAGAYRTLRGKEYLEFVAHLFKSQGDFKQMLDRGIGIASLAERINDKVETYSKGMMRRLLVARALMTRPKLAILDEPSSGLDVLNAREIRSIITQSAKEGMSVLLSSHNMLEVELMCDRIALIHDGRIVATGTPADLKNRYKADNIEDVFSQVMR
jgi:ABC-2 type transport system ATP-binding protein